MRPPSCLAKVAVLRYLVLVAVCSGCRPEVGQWEGSCGSNPAELSVSVLASSKYGVSVNGESAHSKFSPEGFVFVAPVEEASFDAWLLRGIAEEGVIAGECGIVGGARHGADLGVCLITLGLSSRCEDEDWDDALDRLMDGAEDISLSDQLDLDRIEP